MTFRWWVEEELTIDGTQYVVLQLRYIPPHIKLFHCTDTSGQHTTFLLQMVVLQPKIFSGCIFICTWYNWSFQCKVSKWRVRCEMMIWYSVVVYRLSGAWSGEVLDPTQDRECSERRRETLPLSYLGSASGWQSEAMLHGHDGKHTPDCPPRPPPRAQVLPSCHGASRVTFSQTGSSLVTAGLFLGVQYYFGLRAPSLHGFSRT